MKVTILLFFIAFIPLQAQHKEENSHEEEKEFNPKEMIMHHMRDAHSFHLWDWNGHGVEIALPVILWVDGKLVTFMSSAFKHDDSGKVIAEKKGHRFVKYHEKIYRLNEGMHTLDFDEDHHAVGGEKVIDLSMTKNVSVMLLSLLILLLIFIRTARKYKRSEGNIPVGIAKFVEPLVLFVRDQIALPLLGEKRSKRFLPYLLTIFFFIWLNNIFGLIPIINGANVSGNISFTMTLALFTFIITTISGNKNYWKHIFWMPGVPVPLKIFLAPIELLGVFIKPISLMIRLFANITAGHIIVLSLISLIFIFKSMAVAPISIAFSLFITVIEIIVTAIQAFIFTILSALYFSMATEEEHH